ncbi:MAG: hypothetical protein VX460_06400 [Planctomycetota bacterium]|nr:hypothetical protein [Planctomycetota bacterium]
MNSQHKHGTHLERHLAQLKLVSRLLGHELHSQGGSKAIALSREQVLEMQTSLDLFIDEASKRLTGRAGGYGPSTPTGSPAALEAPSAAADTPLMPARN